MSPSANNKPISLVPLETFQENRFQILLLLLQTVVDARSVLQQIRTFQSIQPVESSVRTIQIFLLAPILWARQSWQKPFHSFRTPSVEILLMLVSLPSRLSLQVRHLKLIQTVKGARGSVSFRSRNPLRETFLTVEENRMFQQSLN